MLSVCLVVLSLCLAAFCVCFVFPRGGRSVVANKRWVDVEDVPAFVCFVTSVKLCVLLFVW